MWSSYLQPTSLQYSSFLKERGIKAGSSHLDEKFSFLYDTTVQVLSDPSWASWILMDFNGAKRIVICIAYLSLWLQRSLHRVEFTDPISYCFFFFRQSHMSQIEKQQHVVPLIRLATLSDGMSYSSEQSICFSIKKSNVVSIFKPAQ